MNQLKVCAKCKQIKPASDFGIDKTNKSGLQSWCRSCKAVWARRYYALNNNSKITRQTELLNAAREILSDFNRYGKVLQVGDNGEYGTESAIGRLSKAIHDIE